MTCSWCAFPLVIRDGEHAAWCPTINPTSHLIERRSLSPADVAWAYQCRVQGWAWTHIGAELGVNRTTIRKHVAAAQVAA